LSHRLVRGLDYYVRTTFEVVSGELGAQNSVLGGGRYDGLVKEVGGPDIPGIGFALGMERLVMLVPAVAVDARCDVFLAPLVPEARDFALRLQRQLRQAAVRVLMDHEGRGLKSQMKRADKLGARLVAIMGEDELKEARWTIRDMKASSQEQVGLDAAADYLIKETTGG
jgi:histidyl-tRNA synthetase